MGLMGLIPLASGLSDAHAIVSVYVYGMCDMAGPSSLNSQAGWQATSHSRVPYVLDLTLYMNEYFKI